jgi:hypothetical protein
MRQRIHRVLAIARAFGHVTLVLGAWGCGAFKNDPYRTATNFRQALENAYGGAFSNVVFAITDWSPERIFSGLSVMCCRGCAGNGRSHNGVPAVLYCSLFLYFAFAGAGAWSLDALIARMPTTSLPFGERKTWSFGDRRIAHWPN